MNWEAKVQAYLDANKGSLRFATIDQIVAQVKLYVLGNREVLSDSDVRRIVAGWSIFNPTWLLPEPLGGGSGGGDYGPPAAPRPLSPKQSGGLLDDVQRAVSKVSNGVTFTRDDKSFNIKVTGATAKLQTASGSASVGISWTGTLGLKAESGPFHFAGELSVQKWEIDLTFPDDDSVPNLSMLPTIFAEGEKAVRKIAVASATFTDISDAKKIGALVKPHVAALEEAVSAASGIPMPDKKSGKSFGFKLGSPDPMPGATGMPAGVQGTMTFTYWF